MTITCPSPHLGSLRPLLSLIEQQQGRRAALAMASLAAPGVFVMATGVLRGYSIGKVFMAPNIGLANDLGEVRESIPRLHQQGESDAVIHRRGHLHSCRQEDPMHSRASVGRRILRLPQAELLHGLVLQGAAPAQSRRRRQSRWQARGACWDQSRRKPWPPSLAARASSWSPTSLDCQPEPGVMSLRQQCQELMQVGDSDAVKRGF